MPRFEHPFLDSSELSSVNASPLGVTLVSEDYASTLPLSLDAIIAAGCDRDFSRLPGDVGAVGPAVVPSFGVGLAVRA